MISSHNKLGNEKHYPHPSPYQHAGKEHGKDKPDGRSSVHASAGEKDDGEEDIDYHCSEDIGRKPYPVVL